jgi:hypothetical protein
MSGKIGGHSISHLLDVAKSVVEKKTKDTAILDEHAEDKIPKFDTKGSFPLIDESCRIIVAAVQNTAESDAIYCSLLVHIVPLVSYSQSLTNDALRVFTPHVSFKTEHILFITELDLGKVLGRGGFCVVSEVTKINLAKKTDANTSSATNGGGTPHDEHAIHNIVQDRAFMAEHCIRKGKDCRYAVKKVQESSSKDEHTFVNAVVDLAIEARFLSVVRHPNVIKMRAMYEGSPYKMEFFVVLDKLYDIMPDRIKKWKNQKGGVKSMFKSKKAKQAFWVERLTVAYDIACALSYLHGLKYVLLQ